MSKVIYVSDYFLKDLVGGAELTFQTLIDESYFAYNSEQKNRWEITKDFIDKNLDSFWVFGNTGWIDNNLIFYIAKKLKGRYFAIEFDYKYCERRLPNHSNHICTCEQTKQGKIYSVFYHNSAATWWMSQKQKEHYEEKFPLLKKKETSYVLSSVFREKSLKYLKNLRELSDKQTRSENWLIQGSDSWVKGKKKNIENAEKTGKKYEVIENLDYYAFLEKLSNSRGLIFHPAGFDTCPRVAIEAKLLGCELDLGEMAQHRDEKWFQDESSIYEHIRERKNFFQDELRKTISQLLLKEERYNQALEYIKENKINWSFAIPSYNEGYRLKRFLNSCSKINSFGLNDIFIVNHRSDDNTEEILKEMKPILQKFDIQLRWTYESRDFSNNFTMADLRTIAINGCKNKIVHSTDADSIIGKNFLFLVESAFKHFNSSSEIYAVGYEQFSVDEFIKFNNKGNIVDHGCVYPHVSIPRWLIKEEIVCRQDHCGGKYFWFYPKSKLKSRWVTVPYGKISSTILAINDKGLERKKLRKTMNSFFQNCKSKNDSKNWLTSYNNGELESFELTKDDYMHEDNVIDVDLIGDHFFI
ncbi:glycosyltransferase [Luminiphilus sp.]|nr:glycosyltransferase [Luminiphilus sp.]